MHSMKRSFRKRLLYKLCAVGAVFQLGGCEIGQITTTPTVDGREVIISLIRGIVLTPIDAFITDAINDAFDDEE